MEVEVPVSKELLLILAENLEELEQVGVKIRLTLESDKFLEFRKKGEAPRKTEEDDELLDDWYWDDEINEDKIILQPDDAVIKTLRKLWPAAFVGGVCSSGATGNMEWKEAYITFERRRISCPFCGYEDDFLISYEGYIEHCQNCGAVVRVAFAEDLLMEFEEVRKIDDRVTAEKDGVHYIGIFVDEDTVLLFSKPEVRLTAEDVLKLSKGVLIKHAPLRGDLEAVLKKAKKAGTGAGIYVPSEWIDCEVLAIKLGGEKK